jgi:hypothetical protein
MSDPLSQGLELEVRPLKSSEVELIRWLLEHSQACHHHLTEQIPFLTVASKCNCGCPTIDFALNGTPVPRKGEKVISDFLGFVERELVGVMLFETAGKLSTLEAYSCSGQLERFDFPPISTLHPYGGEAT